MAGAAHENPRFARAKHHLGIFSSNLSSLLEMIMLKKTVFAIICYSIFMTKKYKISKSAKMVSSVFLAAILIEIVNIVLTMSLGSAQADVCPKSTFPWYLSLSLGITSVVLIVIGMICASKRKLLLLYAIFTGIFLILVFAIFQYLLRYAAVGGLDWCAFLGR